VQSLVALHGGRFRLRSELRKGTEAIVWLPPDRLMSARPKPQDPQSRAPAPAETAGDAARTDRAETETWWRLQAGAAAPQATPGC
jgi:two-component system cell cycle sensor histidine kinase PleC